MKSEKLLLILTIVILVTNLNSEVYYAILLITGMVLLVKFFMHPCWIIKNNQLFFDSIPLVFIVVWFYGLCLGLYNNNEIQYIFRNFAGMVFYIWYFFILYLKVKKEKIFNMILLAGIFNVFISILLYICSMNNVEIDFWGNISSSSSTGQGRIYYVGICSVFVAFSIGLLSKFKNIKIECSFCNRLKNNPMIMNVLLILSTFSLAFVAASKGFLMGMLMICLFIFIAEINYLIASMRLKQGWIFFVIFMTLFSCTLFLSGYENIFWSIFYEQDASNILRYEQLVYLLDSINLWGNGLGAVIPGYSRNEDFPYGFEIIYLNLFHKFGVAALFILIIYIYSLLKSIVLLRSSQFKYAVAALGAISFIWPALGNPILFAPQNVILHCCALYLMRK